MPVLGAATAFVALFFGAARARRQPLARGRLIELMRWGRGAVPHAGDGVLRRARQALWLLFAVRAKPALAAALSAWAAAGLWPGHRRFLNGMRGSRSPSCNVRRPTRRHHLRLDERGLMLHRARAALGAALWLGQGAGLLVSAVGRSAAGSQGSGKLPRNYSQCDSLLLGRQVRRAHISYIEVKNTTSTVEHEASTSKIGEDRSSTVSSAA